MTLFLAILITPQLIVAAASDFDLQTIERGYYNAVLSVQGWGEEPETRYYARAREALMRTLGSKDLAERRRQREVYRLIGGRMPERMREKVERDLGTEGLF